MFIPGKDSVAPYQHVVQVQLQRLFCVSDEKTTFKNDIRKIRKKASFLLGPEYLLDRGGYYL
jgi:hypothetical protein